MNKNMKILTIALCAFSVVAIASNFARTETKTGIRVAVVDVQKIVNSSAQINALKQEQQKKMQELTAFVESAKKDVLEQKDLNKRQALEDNYNKELNVKKNKMEKDYEAKLSAVDKNINASIAQQAKAKNYDLVFPKGVVLYGGDDITEIVSQSLK